MVRRLSANGVVSRASLADPRHQEVPDSKPRSQKTHLNRANGNTQQRCRFGYVQPLDIAQDKDLAMIL